MLRCNRGLLQRSVALLLCGIGLCAGPARAADPKLVLAVYAPTAAFESGEARYAFAAKAAAALEAAGVAVEPRAFARAADLEAAARRGQVDLAVVDGAWLAGKGCPHPVLATALRGGEAASRWGLFVGEGVPGDAPAALRGRSLSQPTVGARDDEFVERVLLDGELPGLFGTRHSAPDLASAVAAVSLRKADAVFAPDGAARGLRRLYDAGRIMNPALVQMRASLDPQVAARVRDALVAARMEGQPYEGFRAGGMDACRALAGRLRPRSRRFVLVEPEPASIDPIEALALPVMEPGLPDLRPLFRAPDAAP